MDLKDHGICLAHIFDRFVVQPFQLGYCRILCILESLPLCIYIIDVRSLDRLLTSLIEHELSDGYAAEYTFTAYRNHGLLLLNLIINSL